MTADTGQRIAVSRAQAADMVGLSTRSLARAVRSGELVEHFVSARPVILVDDLRAWISGAPTKYRDT